MDPTAYGDLVALASQLGWPAVFVVGQLNEWWYLRPHVKLMTEQLAKSAELLERARANEAAAMKLAEEAHALALQAVEQNRRTEAAMADLKNAVLERER